MGKANVENGCLRGFAGVWKDGRRGVKILYRYIFRRLLVATVVSTGCLTFVLVLLNAAQRIFDLLVNNDVPFLLIAQLVALLVPSALTFTLPWGC
ncbi:MAG: LptF/LptG family permease [Bdellovibrionaceae bacterium]|nr:LptF/LptG family permease [Pseudobdellovibrionaceae bacterium]